MVKVYDCEGAFDTESQWWWLAIEGDKISVSPTLISENLIVPARHVLLGFASQREQLDAKQYLLDKPNEHIEAWMDGKIRDGVNAGKIRFIKPFDPIRWN